MIKEGLSHISELTVKPEHTAEQMGSGNLPVLSTPSMVALMENAAMLSVIEHLNEGESTVGGFIQTSHLFPSIVGAKIKATATLAKIEGKKLTFDVEAYDSNTMIGKGSHIRFIVNTQKFMKKTEERKEYL